MHLSWAGPVARIWSPFCPGFSVVSALPSSQDAKDVLETDTLVFETLLATSEDFIVHQAVHFPTSFLIVWGRGEKRGRRVGYFLLYLDFEIQ